MKVSEFLREAKKVIENPEKWIKGAHAKDEKWNWVSPVSSRACTFCAVGALKKVKGKAAPFSERDSVYLKSRVLVRDLTPTGYIFDFNDDPATTHADVMNLFDRAIQQAEKEEVTRN